MNSGMLSTAFDRTRPGIRFESRTPPLQEAFPRMDVAAFIGFAECGPLHWPVAIEDMVQFETVFGVTPSLGWAKNGERIYGHLAESVRAFFTQGGLRCWVVRVASSAASSNVFALPGLLQLTPSSGGYSVEPAFVQARSEGSWSDSLHVATRIQTRPIMIGSVMETASGSAWKLRTRSDFVRPGDLLRIVGEAGTQQAFFPIKSIERDHERGENILQASSSLAFARAKLDGNKQFDCDVFLPSKVAPGSNKNTSPAPWPLTSIGGSITSDVDEVLLEFVNADDADRVPPGVPLIVVIRRSNRKLILVTDSTAGTRKLRARAWEQMEIGEPSSWDAGKAAIVSIDMRVRDDKSSAWRIENLGMTPLHPRYCSALPTDIGVHRGSATVSGASTQSISTRPFVDLDPWFPLAGIVNSNDGSDTAFLVPLDLAGNFGAESVANAQESSELERDGLASFDASLFFDQSLRDASIAELMAIANDLRYSAPQPRPLRGIHAVLGWFGSVIQDEVSLIAVPDAVHMPWQGKSQPLKYSCVIEKVLPQKIAAEPETFICCQQLAGPIELTAYTTTPAGTIVRLTWTMQNSQPAVDGRVIEYLVQESATEDFGVAEREWNTPKTTLEIDITSSGRRFFRVQAHAGDESSSWSPAIALVIRETGSAIEPDVVPGAAAREIQRALIRLCVAQGELFPVLSLPKDITDQDAANHIAALYATDGQVARINQSNIDPEGRVGSYAAVYHPWLETRSASGIVCPLPPDGAVLGMFAVRADHGAWVAPANRSLRGVVALHTTLPGARQALLAEAGINLVLNRPEGYTLLSEDTLSSVPDLRSIHVRRLLILLRRMVLRMGEEFTFEPNGQALRALIRQRCYSMLEHMFRAGAFEGRSPAEAFQVSVDDADNPPASIDAGRLIIRIKVRPAHALRFITVRFTLGGGATGIAEESAS